jgi:hypothetical protein
MRCIGHFCVQLYGRSTWLCSRNPYSHAANATIAPSIVRDSRQADRPAGGGGSFPKRLIQHPLPEFRVSQLTSRLHRHDWTRGGFQSILPHFLTQPQIPSELGKTKRLNFRKEHFEGD